MSGNKSSSWNDYNEALIERGISYPSNQERMLRLEEAIQIIRKMWTEEPSASSMENIIKFVTHTAIPSQYRNLRLF